MKMLDTMDIPKMRRDTDDPRNIHWLLRNLQANNSEHPDIDEALKALRDLARQKYGGEYPPFHLPTGEEIWIPSLI